MLESTIKRLKDGAEKGTPEPDPIVEINVDGYIPDSYISDPRYKLELTAALRNLITARKMICWMKLPTASANRLKKLLISGVWRRCAVCAANAHFRHQHARERSAHNL